MNSGQKKQPTRKTSPKGAKLSYSPPRLNGKQTEYVVKLLKKGYTVPQIRKLGKKFDPPFEFTPTMGTTYRRRIGVSFKKMMDDAVMDGLNLGLEDSKARVALLQQIAIRLTKDILHKDPERERIWLNRLKAIGSGLNFESFYEEEFNTPELQQLRGILDDIAKELGGRVQRSDITSKGEKIGWKDFISDVDTQPDSK